MRIIAGELRGRKIGTPVRGVRPTADRVRESLFARLPASGGGQVLDLFAGTGSLGLEALSRGADHVTFVDRSAPVVGALRSTIENLSLEARVDVLKLDARGAIRRLVQRGMRFDLVFLDPPYADYAELPGLLESLVQSDLLSESAWIVVEFSTRNAQDLKLEWVTGISVDSMRTYGETTVAWLSPSQGARELCGGDTE